jgi:dipeptidyl aminopeptidase/acylaminoacyl peptidase
MPHIRSTRTLTTTAALLLGGTLAACSDAPLAPITPVTSVALAAAGGDRLATIEYEGRTAALYLQNADGSARTRVRFVGVHDRVEGNWSQRLLPTTDETIVALGPAKWSPDGSQLAVVVAVAYDQSQVVVMNADGHNLRIASPNGQIIVGDIDWSPDSRHIAYAMSTLPHAMGVDLFATELATSRVQRLTSDSRFSVFDEYRFDESGRGLWFTQFEGWSDDQRNRVSRVYHVTLGGDITGAEGKVVGNAQGIARDGRWVLAIRLPKGDDWWTQELVRAPLDGAEEVVLASGTLQYAELLERDDEAVLATMDMATGASTFDLYGVSSARDWRGQLAVNPNLASLALFHAWR